MIVELEAGRPSFPLVKSFPKSHPHRGPKGFRVITNRNLRTENLARRKNFEYYYVDKAFQNRLAAHSNSTWLKSLVSQPVREIFGKYRRHGEMMDDPLQVPRSYSTPGERAIHDGWDSMLIPVTHADNFQYGFCLDNTHSFYLLSLPSGSKIKKKNI
jgi:hypothetical protein